MARIDDNKELHCSFCGKSESEVQKLISGPGYIFAMNVYLYVMVFLRVTMKKAGTIWIRKIFPSLRKSKMYWINM